MTAPCSELPPYLEPEDRAAAEEHLSSCLACAEEQVLSAGLGRMLEAEAGAAPELPASLRASLVARAAERSAPDSSPADAIRVRLVCTYCHDSLADAEVFCAGCLAPHHSDCFAGHGACAAPGCESRRWVRPEGPGEQVAPVTRPQPSDPKAAPLELLPLEEEPGGGIAEPAPEPWRALTRPRHLRWMSAAAAVAWIGLGVAAWGSSSYQERTSRHLKRSLKSVRSRVAGRRDQLRRSEELATLRRALAAKLRQAADRPEELLWNAALAGVGAALPQANGRLPALDDPDPLAQLKELERGKRWLLRCEVTREAGGEQLRLSLRVGVIQETHGESGKARRALKAWLLPRLSRELQKRGVEIAGYEVGRVGELFGLDPEAVVEPRRPTPVFEVPFEVVVALAAEEEAR